MLLTRLIQGLGALSLVQSAIAAETSESGKSPEGEQVQDDGYHAEFWWWKKTVTVTCTVTETDTATTT